FVGQHEFDSAEPRLGRRLEAFEKRQLGVQHRKIGGETGHDVFSWRRGFGPSHIEDAGASLAAIDQRLSASASAGFFSAVRMSWLFLIESFGSRQRISSNSFTPTISAPIEMLVTRS